MQEVSIRRSRDTGGEEGSHFSNETETSPQDPVLSTLADMAWSSQRRPLPRTEGHTALPIQTLAAWPVITIRDGRFVI